VTTKRDPEVIKRLAAALEQAQRFGDGERPIDAAETIAGASDPIWNAALHWLEQGEMPDEPLKYGYTPRSLTRVKGLVPSAALTALMALEEDPSAALITLKHLADRGPDAGKYPARAPGHHAGRNARSYRDVD
jgi:hypothetical protein